MFRVGLRISIPMSSHVIMVLLAGPGATFWKPQMYSDITMHSLRFYFQKGKATSIQTVTVCTPKCMWQPLGYTIHHSLLQWQQWDAIPSESKWVSRNCCKLIFLKRGLQTSPSLHCHGIGLYTVFHWTDEFLKMCLCMFPIIKNIKSQMIISFM